MVHFSHQDFIEYARRKGIPVERITRTRVYLEGEALPEDVNLEWTMPSEPVFQGGRRGLLQRTQETLRHCLRQGDRVGAVYILCARKGIGLREAKLIMDRLMVQGV